MTLKIINYVEINPNLGTAGQPSLEQFADIKKAGYQVVINLNPDSAASAVEDEGSLVKSLGMDYIYIPVIWAEPKAADLEQFFNAMQQNQGRKVFVHCAMNMRVSAFVYLYRVLAEGAPEETARASMLAIWEPNETWQAFIDDRRKSGLAGVDSTTA